QRPFSLSPGLHGECGAEIVAADDDAAAERSESKSACNLDASILACGGDDLGKVRGYLDDGRGQFAYPVFREIDRRAVDRDSGLQCRTYLERRGDAAGAEAHFVIVDGEV